ncbi:hypothetical protein DJ568_07835 [Mucilaginibacter hurinus]|uniref:AMP-activated protein kinase glycogen-binding domain-containing protein n=1 Tax=Mucilaginibacter hurinus TaxID=2201324 RepID=A0A367GQV0_9SPHI|nr:glycogen-binding domain-containing protein [Mucilaginibacter hurinus]RCH55093.1 hypothetical protein DJ568_07835 [Mucilaginibacter hurinus]
MKLTRHIIIAMLLLLCGIVAYAQQSNLIAAKDELVLLIDLRSSKPNLFNVLTRAGVQGSNNTQVLKGNFSSLYNAGWKLKAKQKYVLQFTKPITVNTDRVPAKPYLITMSVKQTEGRPGYPANVAYGVNKFSRVTVWELPTGVTRFFLPGNAKARKVQLSGSFNSWTTSKGMMTKTDSGWISDIKLRPGIYAYKFIINGHWIHDTNNALSEHDGHSGFNSIYYRYNYTFKLQGETSASRVTVAGSFNKWNAGEIPLTKKSDYWQASLYLHDGMVLYRFNVDGRWVADPANPTKIKDDKGNTNSVIKLGEIATFQLNGYDDARKVCVAGSFNNWKPDNLYLKRVNDTWVSPLILTPGNYGYKFIVDGKWITDPANTCYQVEGGETNSFVAVKPNHTFRLRGYNNARTVRVTGTFNNWNEDQYIMGRKGDEWVMSMKLPEGKVLYKYIVDGNWMLDPGNKLWEPNEHNTGNSIIWVDGNN